MRLRVDGSTATGSWSGCANLWEYDFFVTSGAVREKLPDEVVNDSGVVTIAEVLPDAADDIEVRMIT